MVKKYLSCFELFSSLWNVQVFKKESSIKLLSFYSFFMLLLVSLVSAYSMVRVSLFGNFFEYFFSTFFGTLLLLVFVFTFFYLFLMSYEKKASISFFKGAFYYFSFILPFMLILQLLSLFSTFFRNEFILGFISVIMFGVSIYLFVKMIFAFSLIFKSPKIRVISSLFLANIVVMFVIGFIAFFYLLEALGTF